MAVGLQLADRYWLLSLMLSYNRICSVGFKPTLDLVPKRDPMIMPMSYQYPVVHLLVQILDLSSNRLSSVASVPERLPALHECMLRSNAISDISPLARAATSLDTLVGYTSWLCLIRFAGGFCLL